MVRLVQTLSNVPSVTVNAKRLLERNNQYKVTMILNSTIDPQWCAWIWYTNSQL